MTSPLRSSDEPDVLERAVGAAAVGGRLGAGPAQRRGLGPAASLGDGLGVRREQDGEPQPDRDLDLEPEAGRYRSTGWMPGHVGDGDERDERGRDLDDEHHRVLDQQARVELAERLREGRPQELGIEDAARVAAARRRASRRRSVTKRWKRRVPRPRSTD